MPYDYPAVDPGVYFLKSGATGLVKIGQSRDVGDRVHWICKAAPEALKLIGTLPIEEPRRAERVFHRFFKHRRANGEWFRISEQDVHDAILNWRELESGDHTL